MRLRLIVGCAALVFGVSLPEVASNRRPRFQDFPVKSIFHGVPAAPLYSRPELSLPDADDHNLVDFVSAEPHARDAIDVYTARGPSFAGHYTIAPWSCGTYCTSMAVVDAKTGRIYADMPFGTVYIYRGPEIDNFMWLSFRLDSRLLIVEGCFDADRRHEQGLAPDCNRGYYEWTAPRFKRLLKIPLRVPRTVP